MLTLGVDAGDYITIGPDIVVQVVKVGNQLRLAIDAPKEMKIKRAKNLEADEIPASIDRLSELKAPPKQYDFKRTKKSD